MPTLLSRTRTTALSGALLLTTALLIPSAHAQDPAAPPAPPAAPGTPTPDATAPTPTETPAPAPPPADATPASTASPSGDSGDDSGKSHRFRIGPTVGVYLPTNSKTRDRFGSSWFSFGLGFGPITSISTKGQLGLDLSVQYQQHDGNHVLMVPVGAGYRVALTDNPDTKVVPYVGLTADAYIIDLKSNPDNVRGTHVTGGGSALLGVNFGDSANIEARYQFVSDVKDFNFSGLSLTVGYRF